MRHESKSNDDLILPGLGSLGVLQITDEIRNPLLSDDFTVRITEFTEDKDGVGGLPVVGVVERFSLSQMLRQN